MFKSMIGLAVAATIATAAPAAAATGNVHLTHRQTHRVERIVHRLPYCTPEQVSGCKFKQAHHHAVASFRADGDQWFVRMHHGRLTHVEVYPG